MDEATETQIKRLEKRIEELERDVQELNRKIGPNEFGRIAGKQLRDTNRIRSRGGA